MEKSNRNVPERHGKKGEKDEEEFILARVKQGAIPLMIAHEVKRTTGGIICHLREMACRFLDSGKTMEEVCELTGLPLTDIQDTLKRKELTKQMRELSPKREPATRPFFLNKTEETELDVLRDIRSLLQQLVKQQAPSEVSIPTLQNHVIRL